MADGAPYGSGAPSIIAAHHIEVFQGLRGLGFKEMEIRPVLEALRDRDLPVEELLREALRAIHRQRTSAAAAKTPTWEKPAPPASPTPAAPQSPAGAAADAQLDAKDALRGLGFKDAEMSPVLLALRARDLPLPELIREALKRLARQKAGSPMWENAPNSGTPLAESPTWETARPARKYAMRPLESEGVAESPARYERHPGASPGALRAERFDALRPPESEPPARYERHPGASPGAVRDERFDAMCPPESESPARYERNRARARAHCATKDSTRCAHWNPNRPRVTRNIPKRAPAHCATEDFGAGLRAHRAAFDSIAKREVAIAW